MKISVAGSTEFQRFDEIMKRLLCVPYEELQRRLKAEEKAKGKDGKRKVRPKAL